MDVRAVRPEPRVSAVFLSFDFDMLSPSKRRRWNTLKIDAVARMPPMEGSSSAVFSIELKYVFFLLIRGWAYEMHGSFYVLKRRSLNNG